MRAILINSSGDEPVTTDEAKNHCYITGTRWDSLIDSLISVARETAEAETWKLVMAGTYEKKFDSFPDEDVLEVHEYPIKSIDTITYIDSDGNTQTVSDSDYTADIESYTARIQHNSSWPTAKDQVNAVTVEFTGGYDGSSDRLTVPKKIKQAVLLMVKHWFDNRESVVMSEGTTLYVEEVPQTSKMLLGFESLRRFV